MPCNHIGYICWYEHIAVVQYRLSDDTSLRNVMLSLMLPLLCATSRLTEESPGTSYRITYVSLLGRWEWRKLRCKFVISLDNSAAKSGVCMVPAGYIYDASCHETWSVDRSIMLWYIQQICVGSVTSELRQKNNPSWKMKWETSAWLGFWMYTAAVRACWGDRSWMDHCCCWRCNK